MPIISNIALQEDEEEEVIFCSTNCYMQFALTHQSTAMLMEEKVSLSFFKFQRLFVYKFLSLNNTT